MAQADVDKLKQDLVTAGYRGEKVVILAASTIPTIWAEAQVASARHRVDGITHQIGQHLAQIGNIAANPGYGPILPHQPNPHGLTSVLMFRKRIVCDVMNRDRCRVTVYAVQVESLCRNACNASQLAVSYGHILRTFRRKNFLFKKE